jgi:hypothetical protein
VFDYPGEVLIDEMDLVIDESCDEPAYENDVLMLFY